MDINATGQSAVRLLCTNIVQQMYLSLAAVGALKGVGHTTLEGTKKKCS